LDYNFYQILTDRINAAEEPEKARLAEMRDKLLKLTAELEKAAQKQQGLMLQLLEQILSAPDVRQAAQDNLEAFNDPFIELIQKELEAARAKSDLDRLARLQKVVAVLEEASAPPPELELIDKLIAAPDEPARQQLLQENTAMVTQEFIDLLNNLMVQSDTQPQLQEVKGQIQLAYSSALRYTMQTNLKK
jgi:hypothetical protein